MTLYFRNHIPYGDVKIGNCIGIRALLEPKVCKNYILDKREEFCKELDFNMTQLENEYRMRLRETLET